MIPSTFGIGWSTTRVTSAASLPLSRNIGAGETTTMNELLSLSAVKMAELVRMKEVSSEELVRTHLERIDQVNPSINAVVHVAERALDEARERDLELQRGVTARRLHGVPITVKDSIETAG